MYNSLEDFLKANRHAFVAELAKFNSGKTLKLYPDDALSCGGWLFVQADSGTADWSYARLIVSDSDAARKAWLMPRTEIQLLLPVSSAHLFEGSFQKAAPLLHFTSNPETQIKEPVTPEGFELKKRYNADGTFDFRLFRDDKIVSGISASAATDSDVETAIETAPAWQNKGLATFLLKRAVSEMNKCRKILHYCVEQNNSASLRVARKAGLIETGELTLARFIKPPRP